MHGKQRINDTVDLFLIQHSLHCQADNRPLDPILLDRLFIAVPFALRITALVIVVHCSGAALAAFANHHTLTLAAEQFCGQQKFAFLTKKQAALKEQLEECEAQFEATHKMSVEATAQQETVKLMSGLPDDKLREHLYDTVERIMVYDAESIEIVWKFNDIKNDADSGTIPKIV